MLAGAPELALDSRLDNDNKFLLVSARLRLCFGSCYCSCSGSGFSSGKQLRPLLLLCMRAGASLRRDGDGGGLSFDGIAIGWPITAAAADGSRVVHFQRASELSLLREALNLSSSELQQSSKVETSRRGM